MDSQFEEGCTHRFLVRWRDERTASFQFLGQLSESPPDMGSLFFCLGYDRVGKRLLVNFHLRLKINPASQGVRNLYLAPSVKYLDMEIANPMSRVDATDHDPKVVREFQKAGMDGSSKIFHLLVSLKEPGYVTMPVQGFTKPMTTRSKGLLLSLRSLSRATEFEVYLPYFDEEQLKVFRECSKVLREEGLETPAVDYNSAYNGRAWGKNQWNVYHLEPEEKLPVAWNPLVDDFPPPYEEAVLSPPSNPEALGPNSNLCSLQTDARSRASIREQHGTPPASQSTPIPPSASPDPSAICLPTATEERHDGQNRKRKAEEVPSSGHHSQHAKEQDAAHPKKQKEGDKSTQESIGQPTASGFQKNPPSSRSASISQRSVIDGGPNRRHFDDVQYCCFSDAVAWLKAAWDAQPDAHEAFLPELGMLAQTARERDLGRYERIRVNCMYMLCRRERVSGSSGPFHGELTVDDQVWYVINFVHREIGAGSDILILDELIALDDVARTWKQVDQLGRSDEWQHWKLMFTTQMAVCILVALYRDERDWFKTVTTQTE